VDALAFPHLGRVWHNFDEMTAHPPHRRTAKPLDPSRLRSLALHYVGRFATTQHKLATYLKRRIRERGWEGENDPELDALVVEFAELGYVDDAGYANGRAASLLRRGYGPARVRMSLREAGIAADDVASLSDIDEDQATEAALAFARRKRIGPFASGAQDPAKRQKSLAAMLRAGHSFAVAQKILALGESSAIDDPRR
jgi:regulatory protein